MAISTVTITINGTSYTLTPGANNTYTGSVTAPTTTSWNQTDNVYNCTVTATDTAGNVITANKSDFAALGLRVKETTKPTITITSPTSGANLITNKPTVTWTVTDAGSGINSNSISIKFGTATAITTGITKTPITNGYSCSYTPSSALSDGNNTIYFDVSDNDGNTANQTSVTFKIDTVPPILNISAPANNLITNNATVTVSGTTNDVTSSPVTLTVNGAAVTVAANGSFSTSVTLTEGSNTITIVATDSSGKSTTVTRSVTLDTADPEITNVTLTPNPANTGGTLTITVTVTD